jgi:hypothetical protein
MLVYLTDAHKIKRIFHYMNLCYVSTDKPQKNKVYKWQDE